MGNAVVQFEIGGQDDQLLADFYGALFGWAMTPIPGAHYTLIAASGTGIGGGLGRSRTGEPWATFYAEADDPQVVLDRAAVLGGKTVVAVTQIPGKLTYAMLSDPDGLLVGVAKRAETEAAGPSQPPGGAPVDWFEVRGSDAGATREFYTALFGWTVAEAAWGYGLVTTGAAYGIQGGLGAGRAARWATVYASVPDVAQALARAVELGGSPECGPEPAAGRLEAGAFRDPAGNMFGVHHHTAR